MVSEVRGHKVTWTETIRKTAVFYYGPEDEGQPLQSDGSVNDEVVEALVVDLEEPADTEEVVERMVESVEVLV